MLDLVIPKVQNSRILWRKSQKRRPQVLDLGGGSDSHSGSSFGGASGFVDCRRGLAAAPSRPCAPGPPLGKLSWRLHLSTAL